MEYLPILRNAYPDYVFIDMSRELMDMAGSVTGRLQKKYEETGKHYIYFLNIRTNKHRGDIPYCHPLLREGGADMAFALMTRRGAMTFYGCEKLNPETGKTYYKLEVSDVPDAFRRYYIEAPDNGEGCGICYNDMHIYHVCPGCTAKYCIHCIGNIELQHITKSLKDGKYGLYTFYRNGATVLTEGLLNAPDALKCSYCRSHTLESLLEVEHLDTIRQALRGALGRTKKEIKLSEEIKATTSTDWLESASLTVTVKTKNTLGVRP